MNLLQTEFNLRRTDAQCLPDLASLNNNYWIKMQNTLKNIKFR